MYFAISVTLGMPVPLNLGFLLLLKTETVILDLVSLYRGEVKRACVSGHAFVNSDAHLIHCYVCVFALGFSCLRPALSVSAVCDHVAL